MRFKLFFSIIVFVINFLIMPPLVSADQVPWYSETYSASAQTSNSYDEQTGPPLPISAFLSEQRDCYFSGYVYEEADSDITASTMYINAWGYTYCNLWDRPSATAIAEFSGEYTANAPFLFFHMIILLILMKKRMVLLR